MIGRNVNRASESLEQVIAISQNGTHQAESRHEIHNITSLADVLDGTYTSGQTAPDQSNPSPSVNQNERINHCLSGGEGLEEAQSNFELEFQNSTRIQPLSPVSNEAPFNWYELLANDALGNYEKYLFLSHESRWEFNPATLLQQSSFCFRSLSHSSASRPEIGSIVGDNGVEDGSNEVVGFSIEPWNSVERLNLEHREASLFHYFLVTIGPLLDLFDPACHFSNHVPHLAMYNTGLMKSILAVAAIHRSLNTDDLPTTSNAPPPLQVNRDSHLATQYYYETLNYLSQAMPHQSYAQSSEILVTAVLLGTYEMFDGSNRNWERHLKGTFWILRTQDNDGESIGLRRAAWWAWLRQDVWAAFRDKRRTLTIWQPTRPLDSLLGSDLACRSLYLLSKAVEYSSDEVKETQDLAKRLDEGNLILCALEEWKAVLPKSFLPLPVAKGSTSCFQPIHIHPPAYAAAMQSYHFSKIITILNMPSCGGVDEYLERQKVIDEAINVICGIAISSNGTEPSLAFVSTQCLFSGESMRFKCFTRLTRKQLDNVSEVLKNKMLFLRS